MTDSTTHALDHALSEVFRRRGTRSDRGTARFANTNQWAFRQVTVLCGWFDFVASGKSDEAISENAGTSFVRDFCESVSPIVLQLGGTVAASSDEGWMVCFGWPVVQEQEALAAVRAAQEILAAAAGCHRLFQGQCWHLQATLGIHTGSATVGRSSLEAGETVSLTGLAPSIAALLAAVPDAGVLISHTTQRQIQTAFHCEHVGGYALEGTKKTLDVFRVLGEIANTQGEHELTPDPMREASPRAGSSADGKADSTRDSPSSGAASGDSLNREALDDYARQLDGGRVAADDPFSSEWKPDSARSVHLPPIESRVPRWLSKRVLIGLAMIAAIGIITASWLTCRARNGSSDVDVESPADGELPVYDPVRTIELQHE